jgi:hypothetical protein
MVRQRFIYCGIAAVYILSGEVRAQSDVELRTSLDAANQDAVADPSTTDSEAAPPVVIATRPTTLEVNPPVEPLPPPRKWQHESEDDPYAALGIDMGGLTLFPVMRAGIVASDNPDLSDIDRKGDVGLRLRPSLRIASDWVRHEFTFEGAGDVIYYDERSENDTADANALARLRLDVLRSTTLVLQADYLRSEESGADSQVPDTAVGNRVDQSFGGSAALTQRYGRLATTLRTGAQVQYYGDVELAGGGKEHNSDREYVQPDAVLRVGYETSPAIQPFVEAAYTPRIHFENKDRNGFERNSDGYRAAVGVAFEPSPIWSGELALVYLLREYEDPSLDTIDTFGVNGLVTWRPSELTTFDLTLGTSIDETADAGSSGARVYEGRLGFSHDLRYDLAITGRAGLTYEDFQGTDETNLTPRAGAGILWRMTRSLAWTLDYDFVYNDSNLPDSDYYENRVTAGVEVRR